MIGQMDVPQALTLSDKCGKTLINDTHKCDGLKLQTDDDKPIINSLYVCEHYLWAAILNVK